MGTLPSDGMPDHVREITDQLLTEFTTIGFLSDDDTARQKQPVATIAAPVFDHRGRVAMIVAVHPLEALSRKRIDAIGRRVARRHGRDQRALTAYRPLDLAVPAKLDSSAKYSLY